MRAVAGSGSRFGSISVTPHPGRAPADRGVPQQPRTTGPREHTPPRPRAREPGCAATAPHGGATGAHPTQAARPRTGVCCDSPARRGQGSTPVHGRLRWPSGRGVNESCGWVQVSFRVYFRHTPLAPESALGGRRNRPMHLPASDRARGAGAAPSGSSRPLPTPRPDARRRAEGPSRAANRSWAAINSR